jgi:cellulose synthase/poly-beta-1,6-N-acetylglucosamine synthase-like glycosyltransferase/peptidoglycan/xylan/chitin deacetylase (PgdA/CDA1 family)
MPTRIFSDPTGKRWSASKQWGFVFGVIFFCAVTLFVRSMLVSPHLETPPDVERMKMDLKSLATQAKARPGDPKASLVPPWARFEKTTHSLPAEVTHSDDDRIRMGYVNGWDPNSLTSLEKHHSQLTHACLEGLSFSDLEGNVSFEPAEDVEAFLSAHSVPTLLLLQDLEGSEWKPQRVESLLLGPPERRTHAIAQILQQLDAHHARGLVIDWQQIDPTYRAQLTDFLHNIADVLHARHQTLWMTIPVGDELAVYDLDALSGFCDRMIAVLHDENAESDAPGPIASQPWFEGWLKVLLGYGKPEQWVLSIGTYGYDWNPQTKTAATLSFADTMALASKAGLDRVFSHVPVLNPTFDYSNDRGQHTVWFLDAVTARNQISLASDFGVDDVAVDRLGMEDPQVWPVLAATGYANRPADLSLLEHVTAEQPGNVGTGNLIRVEQGPTEGRRIILPSEREFLAETYDTFASPFVVLHEGDAKEGVALTFDDGPDPEWTPQILAILRKYHVPATFFLIGRQAEQYPDLVRQIVADGHTIGNHTFFHPNLATSTSEEINLELNSTQRLLESITGFSTILFRPPYIADSRPSRPEEMNALLQAQKLGYVTLAHDIDPRDYELPGADAILERVREDRSTGNVILLHDAGGDRSQTVAALPRILDYLKERGDRVVSISDLLSIPQSELMPAVNRRDDSLDQWVSRWGFSTLHFAEECFAAILLLAAVLVGIRTGIIALLAWRHRHRTPHSSKKDFIPGVTVAMAAYNEEKVIAATLRSILSTSYPGVMEIIVVDDGSSDKTAEIVAETFASCPQVRLISQCNTGKAGALNQAIRAARHRIVVTVDADTQLPPDAIFRLVQLFRSPSVGAVSGQAKVGNPRTWIARCQELEYLCGFNLDRRAYDLLNAITVVPGAIGAYRREALEQCGGFSHATLAEDTDLALQLHRLGWRITYAGDAVAYTEAPETVHTLFKQRFRWCYGTLQCLWKHRDLLFNMKRPGLGWFSLPSIWFFQMALVALMPFVDAIVVFALLMGTSGHLWTYALFFLAADWILAVLACLLEGAPLRWSIRIIPMRLLYRPLLSFIVWKALLAALRGVVVGWSKLDRTASVIAAEEPAS